MPNAFQDFFYFVAASIQPAFLSLHAYLKSPFLILCAVEGKSQEVE